MTKYARILELAKINSSTRWIAERIDEEFGPTSSIKTTMAYVRVALRQREGGSESDIDRKWRVDGNGKEVIAKRARRFYARHRERLRAEQRAAYWRDIDKSRAAGRRYAATCRLKKLIWARMESYE